MARTISEIAGLCGVDKTSTNGFVAFLRERGVLVEDGIRRRPGGKGKGATLYTVAVDAENRLAAILAELKD